MSANEDRPDEFEQHAQRVLGESVSRVSGRVRSRLNQARQAALTEIEASGKSFGRAAALSSWRSLLRTRGLMPATGAALAAGLVAVVLFTQQGADRALPGLEGGQAAYDLELLSENDGLELIENFDGSFYEWAASQGEVPDDGASG